MTQSETKLAVVGDLMKMRHEEFASQADLIERRKN